MRAADALLTTAVAALALFVGVQVARRPPVTDRTTPAGATTASGAPSDEGPTVVDAARAAAGQTTESASMQPLTAARLSATPGTYMTDMLPDLHGSLVRWPDRREAGLRVWVQSMTSIRDWDLRYAQMARDAVAEWSGALPMRFDFVLDSATSDIRIVWIDRYPPEKGLRIGTTGRTTDPNGWIVSATIIVAVHDSTGRAIAPDNLAGVVRHEAGHALGLGHSNDPKTLMYPFEVENQITAPDRATLALLYQVAPGPVR